MAKVKLSELEVAILIVEIDRVGPITLTDAKRELRDHGFSVSANGFFASRLEDSGFMVTRNNRGWTIRRKPRENQR